ncbi:YefM-like protein [Thiorhodovibrio winogradskyi]|uniref:YefM-like protein n=1 Tax=Thiorhodovibrio winogradskyi TaxID=77007 RepID=A0ABZ0SFX0_9GAMM|nr:hypothetical protein [Thiorhodovibrio winogradskyi]
MQFYTLQQASADLSNLIASAVRDHEEAAIVSDYGSVILISQEEFNAMRETLRLLADQRSLRALLMGQAQREAGRQPNVPAAEQVFNDLSDFHS